MKENSEKKKKTLKEKLWKKNSERNSEGKSDSKKKANKLTEGLSIREGEHSLSLIMVRVMPCRASSIDSLNCILDGRFYTVHNGEFDFA